MILIIGYGNPLRTDDAVGQTIASALEGWREDLHILTVYQLTPELVDPISQSDFTVFIDARARETPGAVMVEPVEAQADADISVGAFTHHVSPPALLGAARTLYGNAPAGVLISIGAASFEYGSTLSPQLQAMLPAIMEQVRAIIETSQPSP